MRLKDKVAIVTGASRGIGKAIAIALAAEDARVVVAARTEQEGGRLPFRKGGLKQGGAVNCAPTFLPGSRGVLLVF